MRVLGATSVPRAACHLLCVFYLRLVTAITGMSC
jgi:hypothetical protein